MTLDDKLYLLHRKLLDMKAEYNFLISDIEEMLEILSTTSPEAK